MVTGSFSLVLAFFLDSIAVCCFFIRDGGSCVQLCSWVWKYVTQPGYCSKSSSASASVWTLTVLYGWKTVDKEYSLHKFWMSVANSFEFWQAHPYFHLFWNHAVLVFGPCCLPLDFVDYALFFGPLALFSFCGVWRLVVLVLALLALVLGSSRNHSLTPFLDLLGCSHMVEACWKLSTMGLCVTSLFALW